MNTIYLITAAEVKILAPAINLEIQDSLIEGAILLVQDTIVKYTLTQDMYYDLLNNSGSTNYQYIINTYLKNLISMSVWQYLAVSLSLQLNPSGLRIKQSDHSIAAESVDITFYRTYIQNFIDNIRLELSRYILLHSSDYPLYLNDSNGDLPVNKNFRMGRVGGLNTDCDSTKPHYPCW